MYGLPPPGPVSLESVLGYHRGMDFQFVVDLLTAVCAAYAAVGVYRLQRNQDVMAGKVQPSRRRRMRT